MPVAEASAALDDPDRIAALDRGGMLGLIGSLGGQLGAGFQIAARTAALPSAEGLRAVVVCGMGGSGIAGDVLRVVAGPMLPMPVVVVKGYGLPAFCDHDTLVFAMSFSGNTEEAVAAYAEAVARECRVVAASAGGELAALAEADEVPHIPLPPEVPLPRAALGSLAAAPLGVLSAIGLLPEVAEEVRRTEGELSALAGRLGPGAGAASNEAKSVAAWLGERVPVIWGSEGVAEAAALRWKTQLNENAKVPALAGVLPELDHNEIEGWPAGSGERFAVIVLRHPGEHPRIAARVHATREALRESGLTFRDVRADTHRPLPVLFSLMMAGDFVSAYLALLRGVDPSPIPVLSALKERLKR